MVNSDGTGRTKVSGAMVANGDINLFSTGLVAGSASVVWSADSTRVIYSADQDVDQIFELYSVFADGTSRVKLNGALVVGGIVQKFVPVDAIQDKILYLADQDTLGKNELYSINPDGTNRVKLNNTLNAQGDVNSDFQFNVAQDKVYYRADQDTERVTELYSVKLDGAERSKTLNDLKGLQEIWSFMFSPDGLNILFNANLHDNSVNELYYRSL